MGYWRWLSELNIIFFVMCSFFAPLFIGGVATVLLINFVGQNLLFFIPLIFGFVSNLFLWSYIVYLRGVCHGC